MKFVACTFLYLLLSVNLLSQPTTKSIIESSLAKRQQLAETSLLKAYPVRNIGPTVRGGRIVDIDVNLKNTKEFYVAFASGGLFRTVNNGITFDAVFDNLGALGVGDLVLSQSDPNVLYVGTGEKNSSRSSYAGSGVYKTIDGAKTWKHIGLTATQHISRIIVHPEDINTVWVAAIGSLYSTNKERGVFKSTDGGVSWQKTLFINDSTGVIDLVINPANPDQLWASSWERLRSESNFEGSGRGSSIYRSDDGGESWRKSVAGFPQGKQVGRIGLEVCPSNPNIVYAILDNQGELPERKESKKDERPTLDEIGKLSKAEFLKYDDTKLEQLLRDNRFPSKYSATSVKQDVSDGKYLPKALSQYFGDDANKNLFSAKIIGPELYRSDNSGATWKKMNSYDLDGVFFSYGYYFAEMKVSPEDEDLLYLYGVPLLKSRDGGVTWHRLDTLAGVQRVHVDQHALWINPNDPDHLLLGNDGGLYQSYDEGANWRHINNMPVAQFYTIGADMNDPYNVYGGLQDNGVVRGSSKSIPNVTKPWAALYGGDGMYVAPDPRNSRLVYLGYQFGNYFRLDMDKRKTTKITPQHDIGTGPLRWNWCAPLIISKHNADILYTASQKVFRSFDQGDHWEIISDDLTKNSKQGNIPFSTISFLAESPVKFGLLYAGTDDGQVWVSDDGGVNWSSIQPGLPDRRWVSSIFPSPHDEGTVFISLNGYRSDDFETYVFMSKDYGKSWQSIKGNLPESVANTVIQDPVNSDLLYCGLDNGTYVSFDKGTSWNLFNTMLNVSSYAMMVHPRDNELIVGTHGRGVFVADVKPLQSLKDRGQHSVVVAFEPKPIQYDKKWGEKDYMWAMAATPGVPIQYYVGNSGDSLLVECYDEKNRLVRQLTCEGDAGFHTLDWDVRIFDNKELPKAKKKRAVPVAATLVYASPGKYRFTFIRGKDVSEIAVTVEE